MLELKNTMTEFKSVEVDSNRQKKESVNSKTGHFKLSNLRNKKTKIKEK